MATAEPNKASVKNNTPSQVYIFYINEVCCVGRVEIQIEIYKGQCTANTDSIV